MVLKKTLEMSSISISCRHIHHDLPCRSRPPDMHANIPQRNNLCRIGVEFATLAHVKERPSKSNTQILFYTKSSPLMSPLHQIAMRKTHTIILAHLPNHIQCHSLWCSCCYRGTSHAQWIVQYNTILSRRRAPLPTLPQSILVGHVHNPPLVKAHNPLPTSSPTLETHVPTCHPIKMLAFTLWIQRGPPTNAP